MAYTKLLSKSYYKIRKPQQLKKWFKVLNGELFRKFLLATAWRNRDQQRKFFNGKKEGITSLIVQTKKSEFGHLLPFTILTLVSIYLSLVYSIILGITSMTINIIGNFYPILLQRHHRMRVEKILGRIK